MPTITLRSVKGAELTYNELDTNFKRIVVAKTANYTTALSDNRNIISCNGTFTVTLLAASTAGTAHTGDYRVTIKNIGTGTVTVAPSGTDTIDGANSSISLAQNDCVTVVLNSAGNGYDIVNRTDKKVQLQETAVDLNGNFLTLDADGDTGIDASTDDNILFKIGNVNRHVFGGPHVGFGVTALDGWGGGTALQVGTNMALWDDAGGSADYINNAYYNLGWKYASNGYASKVQLANNGAINFSVAPSGIAGNAISWTTALTINNDGSAVFGKNVTLNGGLLVRSPDTHLNLYDTDAADPNDRIIIQKQDQFLEWLFTDASASTTTRLFRQKNDGTAVFEGFTSISNIDVFNLLPTDFGAGKPKFRINKSTKAADWILGLIDTTTSNVGNLIFEAGGFEFRNNGVWIGNPSGLNKGPGSLNAEKLFVSGEELKVIGTYTAMGASALPAPTNGSTAFGVFALGNGSMSGTDNTAIGYYAGRFLQTSLRNTAVGAYALYSETGGVGYNVAIGYNACYTQDGSTENVAIGAYSSLTLTTGFANTTVGFRSGSYITTGSFNTFIGRHAGYAGTVNVTGNTNVCIGNFSSLSSGSVSNEVNIYNGSVTARFQGAASGWSFVSDARDKEDVRDLNLGLDFLLRLSPRRFRWNIRDSEVDRGREAVGFIAQEVLAICEEMEADCANLIDTNDPERYQMTITNLIPIIVKSIQEIVRKLQ